MISVVWEKWERISQKLMFWRHALEVRGGSWDSFRLYGFSARLVPFYVSSAVVFVFVLFCKVSFPMVYFLSVRIWCRKITFRKKPPSTRIIRFCWETEGFFSGLAFRSHIFGENGHLKRIISKTVSRVKLFENAGHLFTCGRTKTEVSEYDDVIHAVHHLPLA